MSGETYADVVNYDFLDQLKIFAMKLFAPTLQYVTRFGLEIDPKSIGEPAAVLKLVDKSRFDALGFNVEGIGTKPLIADNMYELRDKVAVAKEVDDKTLFGGLGIDTVAMSALDQLSVYAEICVYGDLIASGRSSYFVDDAGALNEKSKQLLMGYRKAADEVKFAIPCGEIPTLPGVVYPNTLDLAGGSIGIVHKNAQPIGGANIKEGDRIVILSSSGPHANGISKIRRLAEKLKDGWFTQIAGTSTTLGVEALKPTRIYTRPIVEMLDQEIPIHYMGPITGHGWKKIMRPRRDFSYVIEQVPALSPFYEFLISEGAKHGFDVSAPENYSVWNMGGGWFSMVDGQYVEEMRNIAKRYGLELFDSGHVEKGPRSVVLPMEHNGKRVVYTPS